MTADRPALDGLKVVEIGSGVAVGYATRLLADLGAEVVRVEPSGDDVLSAPLSEQLVRYLGAGKQSTTVDPAGLEAHLVIESLGPGVLDLAPLLATNPRLAVVRISPFGQEGPYRDRPVTDLVLQAAGGWVNKHGSPEDGPVMVGGRLAEYTAGSYAAAAGLTAWSTALDLGEPVVADLSMLECLVGTLPYPMLQVEQWETLGMLEPDDRPSSQPGIVRASDGWVGLNALTGQHWYDLCAMVGADAWADRQRELSGDSSARAAFHRDLQGWLDERTVDEVVELAQAFRIPAAPVADAEALIACPQLTARSWLVPDPEGTGYRPGPPYRLSRTPVLPPRVAPQPDEDERGAIVHQRQRAVTTSSATAQPYLPYSGLRVVELGNFWAGPYATMYLGAMGADVIKVESVQRPDGFRFTGSYPEEGEDWHERSGMFQATNLNKRGVTLDASRPDGRALLQRLIGTCDILVENFSARVMHNFGLDYDDVRGLRPDIIMARMPGFGLEGPWRDYVGWAMVIEQAAGMAWLTGDRDGIPRNPGGFIDPIVGMHTVTAILAALEHREHTGEGQQIEVAQLEVGACLSAEQIIAATAGAEAPMRSGNRSRSLAPQGVYGCADDWVALSVRDDGEWKSLVGALGRPSWATVTQFDVLAGRLAGHDEIDAGLSAWTQERTASEVTDVLDRLGIPGAMLLTPAAMYTDPQLVARDWYQELPHPVTGGRRYPGWPMRWSWAPGRHHRFGAPTLGQHNAEVLGEVLDVAPSVLARLERDEIIGNWPRY